MKKSAFTLIELLTVIGIIGVLAAILIPAVGKVRDAARKSECSSNLRQLSGAYLLMVQDNNNIIIPAIKAERNGSVPNSKWWVGENWNMSLASYMLDGKPRNRLNDMNCPIALDVTGQPSERSTYGFNHFVGKTNATDGGRRGAMRMEQLVAPNQTIMFGDTDLESDSRTLQFLDHTTIHAWHGEEANISYFDGSVGTITIEEAQAKGPSTDEGYVFWRGVYRR